METKKSILKRLQECGFVAITADREKHALAKQIIKEGRAIAVYSAPNYSICIIDEKKPFYFGINNVVHCYLNNLYEYTDPVIVTTPQYQCKLISRKEIKEGEKVLFIPTKNVTQSFRQLKTQVLHSLQYACA